MRPSALARGCRRRGSCRGATPFGREGVERWVAEFRQLSTSSERLLLNLWTPDPAPARDEAVEAPLRGFLALMDGMPQTKELPTAVKTVGASASAAGFRCFLRPVDALKTTLQVHGAQGLSVLSGRIAEEGVLTLWSGALATSSVPYLPVGDQCSPASGFSVSWMSLTAQNAAA